MLKKWNDYITADFSDEELEQLAEMLGRIAERARNYSEDTEAAE